ncbi:MAG TPA: PIN domain nuclease, partial [Armatimonadetes bacterium]|nr:PIN domain nuclease [Armatimonadota bacterium]
ARGRRGLDLLNRLKEEVEGFRVLKPRDYAVPVNDVHGVDGKLVKLASAMDAWLLTNDFNLAKVAEVQNIRVLNVNRLAIALKPVVMAGEELRVNIIRQGRDPGQGVAYLDDGTMVVVEEADHKIGRVVDVVVSSMLQ